MAGMNLKALWSYGWRLGLFILGMMVMGITTILSFPTMYNLVYVEKIVDPFWYEVALIAPIMAIIVMVLWTFQSTRKIEVKQ